MGMASERKKPSRNSSFQTDRKDTKGKKKKKGQSKKSLHDSENSLQLVEEDLDLSGSSSSLDASILEQSDPLLQEILGEEIALENTYRTRYVTIDPDSIGNSSTSSFSQKNLPALKASDASWLHAGDDSGSSLLSAALSKNLHLSKKAEEKLHASGLLGCDDSDESGTELKSKRPNKAKKEKKDKKKKKKEKAKDKKAHDKKAKDLRALKSTKSKRYLMDDYSSEEEEPKKSTHKEVKQLFQLLNLDPSKRRERRKFSDEDVRLLIDEYPDLAAKKCRFTVFEDREDGIDAYPLSMLCALGATKATVKKCFKAFPKAAMEADNGYGCPLHYACAFQASEDIVAFLVKHQPKALKCQNEELYTPLHVAAVEDACTPVVALLIEKDPSVLTMADDEGNTPLHVACIEDADMDVLEKIATSNTAVCKMRDRMGATPLHLAIFHEAPHEVVEFLVDTEDGALKVGDIKDRLPIHVAAASDTCLRTMKLLVDEYPDSVDSRTKSGKTPYGVAKKAKRGKDVLSLLSK